MASLADRLRPCTWNRTFMQLWLKLTHLSLQNAVLHHQPTRGQLAATYTFDKDFLTGFQGGNSGPLRAWKITTKVRKGHRRRVEPHHHPSLLHRSVFKNSSDQYSLSGVFGVRCDLV